MRPVGQTDRTAGAADLLHGHHMLQVTHARPAIFLPDGQSEQPQLPELRPKITRKLIATVDLLGAGCDLLACKLRHRLAQQIDVLAQPEIEGNHDRQSIARGATYAQLPPSRASLSSNGAGCQREPRLGASVRMVCRMGSKPMVCAQYIGPPLCAGNP